MQRRNLFDVLPPVDLNGGNDFGDGGNDFGACAQHDRVVATVGGGVVEEVAVLRTHPFGMAAGERLETGSAMPIRRTTFREFRPCAAPQSA